ncbi:MAG: hypothetical protein MUC84_03525 [Solirubrobacteraceae bacterium]|jgi:hypothetical protein|nr:hypothetical protein [Solirubrobacteraceae bacterium]
MGQRRWSDLTEAQRRGIAAGGAAQLALALAAAISIHGTPEDRVRGRKGAWYLACLVNWAGPLAWFAVGRRRAPQ